MVTVRFLSRGSDATLVVHPRAARRLIRPYRETNHICCVRHEVGLTFDVVLDRAGRPHADTTEIWLLPKDVASPALLVTA
jgi:hypothetical protein